MTTADFPLSEAETRAGLSSGDIVRPAFPYGHVLRYGADPDGDDDSWFAIQAAANVVSHEDDGLCCELVIPKGLYLLGADLLLYRDPKMNPGWNYDRQSNSRIIVRGGGGGLLVNAFGGDYSQLSQLDFAPGCSLRLSDRDITTSGGGTTIKDLVVTGDVDFNEQGRGLVHADICPGTLIEGVSFYNEHESGVTLYLHGVWESVVRRANVYGHHPKFKHGRDTVAAFGASRCIFLDTAERGAGLLELEHVTCRGGRVGFDLGLPRAVSAKKRRSVDAMRLVDCQALFCGDGMRFRSGIRRAELLNPWFENNLTANVRVSDGALLKVSDQRDTGMLYVRGGSWSVPNQGRVNVSMEAQIVLGKNTGDPEVDCIGNVLLENVQFNSMTNIPAIRRFNARDNGFLKLRDCGLTPVSGLLQLDDAAQFGSVFIENSEDMIQWFNQKNNRMITDSAMLVDRDGKPLPVKDLRHWVVFEGAARNIATLPAGETDYRNAKVMPQWLNASDADLIRLPDSREMVPHVFCVYTTGGAVVLDAGRGRINGAKKLTLYGPMTLVLEDNSKRRWTALPLTMDGSVPG